MKKIISNCIIALIVLFFLIALTGCSRNEPVSNTIADNAINATTALEQGLKAECKTAAITTQITVIKTQIKAVANACQTEKDQITQEKIRWKWSFWILMAVIGAYITKRVFK